MFWREEIKLKERLFERLRYDMKLSPFTVDVNKVVSKRKKKHFSKVCSKDIEVEDFMTVLKEILDQEINEDVEKYYKKHS